jgi:hypothetical protein
MPNLNKIHDNMTLNENDINSKPDLDTQAKIEEAMNSNQEYNQEQTISANLDQFGLTEDNNGYLLVSHAALNNSYLGKVGVNEYASSKDKVALLKSVAKDAFPQTKIAFEGSFVEPVIEKAAVHEHEYQKRKSGVEICPCGRFRFSDEYLQGHPPIVEQPVQAKDSWLTADVEHKPCPNCGVNDLLTEDEVCLCDCHGPNPEFETPKIAIQEDASNKNYMTDHLAQSLQLEDQKVASANDKIKTEAVNALVAMLQGMGHGSAKVAEVSMSDHKVDAMVTLDDAGTIKAVNIPVEIKADKVVLPKHSLVSELISKGLDINAKLSEEFGKQVIERIAAEEARIAYETEEANQIIAEKVTKEAGAEPKTQFEGTNETVYLNKHLIPADVSDLDIGNVVHVDGVSYKLVSKSKDQLSKGEDDASTWVFERVQPVATETSKKEKEINK